MEDRESADMAKLLGLSNERLNEMVLDEVEKLLLAEGYDVARIYIDKVTKPEERNSLQRIITTCQNCNISPDIAAGILRSLKGPKID